MSGRLRVAIIAGFSVFIFSIAAADVPPLINFQGKLTDTLGFSVEDSNYQLSFSIWDSSTSGIQKWSENQTVTVKGGLFNVLLGSINPIPDTVFNSPSRWLAVKSGLNEVMPRQRFVSVAYAMRSKIISDGLWTTDGTNAWRENGRIGIGTTTPIAKLDIVETALNNDLLRIKGTANAEVRVHIEDDQGGKGDIGKSTYDLAGFQFVNHDPGNAVNIISTEGDINFRIHPDTGALWEDASLTKLHIDKNTGNVGVGTTAPGMRLESKTTADGIAVSGSAAIGGFRLHGTTFSNTALDMGIGAGGVGNNTWLQATDVTDLSQKYILSLNPNGGNVGIGTTSPQGALDVSSTTGAFIVPRMTTAQRDVLAAVNGMIIYNTDAVAGGRFEFRENGAWVTK